MTQIKCSECEHDISLWDSFKNLTFPHLFHVVCPTCKYPNKIKKSYCALSFSLGFLSYYAGKYSFDIGNPLPLLATLVTSVAILHFSWRHADRKVSTKAKLNADLKTLFKNGV